MYERKRVFIAAQKSFKGKNGRKEKRRKEGRKKEEEKMLLLLFLLLLLPRFIWHLLSCLYGPGGEAAGSNSLGFAVLKNLYARRRRRCYMANGRGCVIAKKSFKNEKKKDGGVKNKCATRMGVGLLCCRDGWLVCMLRSFVGNYVMTHPAGFFKKNKVVNMSAQILRS